MFHDFSANETCRNAAAWSHGLEIQVAATALLAEASASCKESTMLCENTQHKLTESNKTHLKQRKTLKRHNYRHYWSCLVKRFQYWLSILSLLRGVGSLQLDIQRPVDMGTSAAETLFLAYISLASQPTHFLIRDVFLWFTFPLKRCMLQEWPNSSTFLESVSNPFIDVWITAHLVISSAVPQLCLELSLSFLPLGLELWNRQRHLTRATLVCFVISVSPCVFVFV